MNIYVANLSGETTVEDLVHAFEGFGQVTDATIIRDKKTGYDLPQVIVSLSKLELSV